MGRLCLRFHRERDICPQGGTQSGHKCPQAHPTVILRHGTQGRGRHFGAKTGGGGFPEPTSAAPEEVGWP